MPVPAVYVLAVIGTVGAALAFKEFVYEPHIAPAIDRWKAEYQAARRRRDMAAIYEAQDVVQMSQRRNPKSKGSDKDKFSDDDGSDDENHLWHGKGTGSSNSRLSKGGLLLMRPDSDTQNKRDVELDNLVAPEVNEWRSAVTGQVLRQRKKVSEHVMEESIQAIPYAPLSPLRTHVVFDPSSPSTSNSESRVHSPLHSSPAPSPLGLNNSGGNLVEQPQVPSPKARQEPVDLMETHAIVPAEPSPLVSSATSPTGHTLEAKTLSPPPQVTITQSILLGNIPPTFNILNPSILSPPQPQPQPHAPPYFIPSLSQSYPQDLDCEHGLELLSPPSSRAESPFSMAEMSPNSGLRALSPSSAAGSRSMSAFSSAMSSPSPLRMGLGNQSFDVVSPPAIHPQPSPFLNPSENVTDSAKSTTYLSFADEFSDDDYAQAHPYGNLAASTGVEGTFGQTRPQSGPSMPRMQPGPIHSSFSQGHIYTNTSTIPYASAPPPAHIGLGIFPVPAREPRTPVPISSEQTSSAFAGVAIGAGAGDASYFRPSSASSFSVSARTSAAGAAPGTTSIPPSDGELSDLDFMSDYEASEVSDMGDETDSSWGMAGGSHASGSSAAGSPMLSAAGAPAGLTRGGTVREASSRAGRSSPWA